jgi:hypothetical protein
MKQKTAIEWLIRVLELESFENINLYSMTAIEQAKEMEKEQIMRAYDIGSNEGYDLAKIDDIEEGHYMKEPIEYYKEIYEAQND